METRCRGIVLAAYPYSETSLIVHWLTDTEGRIATLAKGARRPKSRFEVDLYYLCDLVLQKRGELHLLKEAALDWAPAELRRNIAALETAAYASKLVRSNVPTDENVFTLFQAFEHMLRELETGEVALAQVAFSLRYLQEMGLLPSLSRTSLSPGAQRVATGLIANPFGKLPIRASPGQLNELQAFTLMQLKPSP